MSGANLDINVNMKDGASSVDKVRDKLKAVKGEAIATDKSISKAGTGSGNVLNNVVGKIGGGFRTINGALSKTGSLLGVGLSSAVLLSKVFGEMERQAEQIRDGFKGITDDMRAEMILKGAMGAGMISTDTVGQLNAYKAEMDKKGLRMLQGDYTTAAASLAGASDLRGEDLVEGVKVAMQLWAAGGGAGTLQDAALQLATTLGTGQVRALRTKGVFLDESKYEGMDEQEKSKAVYADLKAYLARMNALEQFAGDKDPRARLIRAEMASKTSEEEYKQREAGGITTEMKIAALKYREGLLDMGVDPDNIAYWREYMMQRELDPTSGAMGAILRWLDEKFGAGEYDRRKAEALNIDTNPAEKKR